MCPYFNIIYLEKNFNVYKNVMFIENYIYIKNNRSTLAIVPKITLYKKQASSGTLNKKSQ